MLYTPKTKQAMKLCFSAHKDQTDKSGLPYVFHPFHLAEQMEDEDSVVVALLHDIVEDTDYTLDDLRNMGFGEQVVGALALLTHDKDVPYLEYVSRIKPNPIARAVKLADLRHNSDITRLDLVTEHDMERVLKYKMAEAVLAYDRYDVSGGYYRKALPLDHKALYFLSIFYTPDRILKYAVDVEAAADSHYDFDEPAARRLKPLLPEAESLPEALAKYFARFNQFHFADLMKKHDIPYKKSFFPNFDDMD